ncbi:hypothetical protein [Plebeiibacterium marinum]|uniref:Transposase n=1 Tax=Plebeiibacterium marinum TaxID=2992111 RepID=A0AAE3MEF1_9BACT|nr:hypothetical protein [Plebeiobacterium marinum]MCW3806246.1 hypothetical protein [Plebeiobacterium marinum]
MAEDLFGSLKKCRVMDCKSDSFGMDLIVDVFLLCEYRLKKH